MNQWIQIWYSWGDQEAPVEVPAGTDAWKYALHLAAEEAAASQEMAPGDDDVWTCAKCGEEAIVVHE